MGSQGSLHDRNLTGGLHLQRCLYALFKSSLTIRTLKRSIYFLGIVREMAAEKTAGQDLAPLYPSVLFCSPTPPPPSLIGHKNRDNNENGKKKKKRGGSAVHSTGQVRVTALVSGSTCSCTGQVLYFQILPPLPLGLRYSSHSTDDMRSSKCRHYKQTKICLQQHTAFS